MYKLLATRVTKRMSSHGVFIVPKQTIVQRSMRFCIFCNLYHGRISKLIKYHIRTNATVNAADHYLMKNKIKQKTKKYIELLTVTDNVTTTKMKEVKKLTNSTLSKLVNELNATTDKTHDLKSSSISEISHMEDIANMHDDLFHHNSLNNEDYLNTLQVQTNFGKKIKYRDESLNDANIFDSSDRISMKQKLNTKVLSEQESKKNNTKNTLYYMQSLLIHMQVYVNCGMLKRANKTLMKHRKYLKNHLKHPEKCVELYNVLLEAYASRRKVTEVFELYNLLKMDSLKPTPQTYVYLFDALGRKPVNKNQTALLQKLHSEMKNYNICYNDMFNKSYVKNDQRENVLKSIRVLEPDFTPVYNPPETEYTCKLLNNLSKNNYKSPVEKLLTMEELKSYLEIQIENESTVHVQIKSIELQKDSNPLKSEIKVREVEDFWRDIVTKAFERNLSCLEEKECRDLNSLWILHPFFKILDKEEYINAILREVRELARGSETYSSSLKTLHINLGRYINKKYQIQMKKQSGMLDKIISIYMKYLDWYLHPEKIKDLKNMNNRSVWQHLECKELMNGISLNVQSNWPMDITLSVGKFLYDIILNDLILKSSMVKEQDVKSSIPAFYTLFRNKGFYLSEQIKPHPLVSKLYKESQMNELAFASHILPSYIPPRPWTSIYDGGYLLTNTDFMRLLQANTPWYKLQNTPTQQLFPILDALNQLGSIPWIINTKILDIIIEIFQNGGSKELNVPPPVSTLSRPPDIKKGATIEEKQNALITMTQYRQKKCEMHSLWCDCLYRLSIANHFRNRIFWLPHSLDFRGRVYPVPPHLNHLSSDLGRSLLLFAKAEPLGPNGLDWLKLHVVNLTSFKKGSSVKERIEYANENMENILDSAANPTTGKMWWAQSENPWQTLAGCIEIANALKAPNVEEYMSRFPIHQDGSCNGLQHYAALGRDQIGAESVNLYPFDTPKDVYTAVATVIEKKRQRDAASGNQIAQILEGHVKRKVIKQTVMTTVYGVTQYGAKLQIMKQLKDLDNFPQRYVWSASAYLVESTFFSLRTMFNSAREIQDWFTICAHIISSVCGENVEWVTPLGLPIVQPYTKQQKQFKRKPDSLKQKNAFPPNFIHSLDSSHMMLTSLYCNQENVTFVSVHDCFWTHACSVEIMNKICREQFVALHSEPILENLSDYFVQRYIPIYEKLGKKTKMSKNQVYKCFTSIPPKGNFNIRNVLSSVYFFN